MKGATLFLAALLLGCAAERMDVEKINVNVSLSNETGVSEKEILKIAGLESGVVTELTPQNLTELAEEYPVIYGNLPNKTLYLIKTENKLIIVDAEEKKVLKKFRLVGVDLGG